MPALFETLPQYLADWSSDHRPLSDAHRQQVGDYIMAIVSRQSDAESLGPDGVVDAARELWVQFRTTYDGLRGPYQRSEAEDVRRAMGRL